MTALIEDIILPGPVNFGLVLKNANWVPLWITKSIVEDSCRELVRFDTPTSIVTMQYSDPLLL